MGKHDTETLQLALSKSCLRNGQKYACCVFHVCFEVADRAYLPQTLCQCTKRRLAVCLIPV